MVGPGPLTRPCPDVPGAEPRAAAVTAEVAVELATALPVLEGHRRAVGPDEMPVAPLHQSDDHRPQVEPLFGQAVLVARGMFLIGTAVDQLRCHEPLEPVLENVAGDPEVAPEVVETMDPHHQLADHEQRPSLADECEGAGDAALLAVISTVQRHEHSVRK